MKIILKDIALVFTPLSTMKRHMELRFGCLNLYFQERNPLSYKLRMEKDQYAYMMAIFGAVRHDMIAKPKTYCLN